MGVWLTEFCSAGHLAYNTTFCNIWLIFQNKGAKEVDTRGLTISFNKWIISGPIILHPPIDLDEFFNLEIDCQQGRPMVSWWQERAIKKSEFATKISWRQIIV